MTELKNRIQEGLDGKFEGLENGFKDLNDVLFGVQKKCYTLIGGLSGTYKTTLLDYIFLNALKDAEKKNIKIDVFYYSFEIDKLTKQCNWLSQLAYKKYKLVIPPEKIKGLGNNRLNSKEQSIVEGLIPEVEEMFNKINFIFDSVNPYGIYKEIFDYCISKGTAKYENYIDENGKTKQRITSFKWNEDRYLLIGIDHLYLAKKEKGNNTKENMDKLSTNLVSLRNLFGVSPFVVQQFNQGLNAVDRAKFKGIDLSPQQTDFKDTTNPYQDCDIALGIINPFKLDMFEYNGYNIQKFRDRFISLKVIKNRLSKDNVAKGLLAKPEVGSFEELPKPNVINYEIYQ